MVGSCLLNWVAGGALNTFPTMTRDHKEWAAPHSMCLRALDLYHWSFRILRLKGRGWLQGLREWSGNMGWVTAYHSCLIMFSSEKYTCISTTTRRKHTEARSAKLRPAIVAYVNSSVDNIFLENENSGSHMKLMALCDNRCKKEI